MIEMDLKPIDHEIKVGQICDYIEPNIIEDTLFKEDGNAIGFYISDISKYSQKLKKLIDIADAEFISNRVPKSVMKRSSGVEQRSTILGFIPAKPNFKRNYHSVCSVHQVDTAQHYIKAMIMASNEAMQIIKAIVPTIYQKQKELTKDIPDKYKIGQYFTSSIANHNIAADFHRDTGNIADSVNVIITRRRMSKGGCLHVPDYNLTFDCANNSMIVYPAWKNVHGVTPIKPLTKDGYRNSLIFYPLKGALNV